MAQKSQARTLSLLRKRLEARRSEIEQAALTRVNAIADSSEAPDPTYVEGLHGAVAAAVDYGLAAIECGDERALPIPVVLLAQARTAARSAVSLDTVLRRYFAGYSLLGYFIVEEASKDGLMSGPELQRLLGMQAVIFDRLLAAVSDEHTRESQLRAVSSTQRQAERIERLLEGELIDTADIAYEFDGWHLGAVACGTGAEEGLRDLARNLDSRLLLISSGDRRTVWAWFGARRRPDPSAVRGLIAASWDREIPLAVGEPGSGMSGWRLTHRQAAAALQIPQRGGENPAHYADVALLASVLKDDLVASSLRQLFLAPLQRERDGGRGAKETLRAYFAADQNVSSTAAALGVKRHTVTNRLRGIEETIGRQIDSHTAEIDAALRLDELADRKQASSS